MRGYDIANNSCLNETDRICPFRLANGIVLTTMSSVGLVTCVWVTYNITFGIIRLHGGQNVFVLNVLFHDLMVAAIGIIRGLGIINKFFIGVNSNGEENSFCAIFSIIGILFWNNPIVALLPLTLDRFLAVTTPLKHKKWMSNNFNIVLIVMSWLPALCSTLYPLVEYNLGVIQINYQAQYHRCTLDNHSAGGYEAAIFYFLPILILISLYSIMTHQVIRHRKRWKKLGWTSLTICSCSILIAIPQTLLYTSVHMSYETAQLLTVTLFYTTPLCDSIVYYLLNPHVIERIPDSGIGRTARRISQGVSRINANVRLSFTLTSEGGGGRSSLGTPTSVRSFAGRLSPSLCYRRAGPRTLRIRNRDSMLSVLSV